MKKYDAQGNPYIPADITAERSIYDNCLCETCHKTGYVTKIRFTMTKFWSGKALTQKMDSLWVCDECFDKLMRALEGARNERKNQGL